uniref:Uncharacterized protein n=1 Tax=Opuntia streptacantha TaxID=393608 RepID=A0A7C8Z4V6_OPUST
MITAPVVNSTSAQCIAQNSSPVQSLHSFFDVGHKISHWSGSGKRLLRSREIESINYSSSCSYVRVRKTHIFTHKTVRNLFPFASADDGVTVNGGPESSTSRDVEAMRIRLDQALQNEDYNDGLVQSLYDAARVFELSIKERISLSKISLFSVAWLGIDRNAWIKELSYQAAVYALLQAANDISSRVDGRERDVNVAVQRSLLRLSAPLESVIRDKLCRRQPENFEWFWSERIPVVVDTFVNHFERDPRFKAATTLRMSSGTGGDVALLVLALICIATIMKLGPAKVPCSQLFTMVPDVTASLMDVLVRLVSIREAYHAVKEIGLHREFLVHFGPRAASCGMTDDCMTDEMVFWVDLVQMQLQRAIDKEKIWSRLTTSESIEVLERDLAIFGFFIALGRSTRSFLVANGFDKIDEPIEGFIRYLVGGCVLFYPQFSSMSSYELYVEVVCEELDWLPFYPGCSNTYKGSHGHKNQSEGPPNIEAIFQVLNVCSHWIRVFMKHSKWVQNPANVKAARFLSKGQDMLEECKLELGSLIDEFSESKAMKAIESAEANLDSDSFDKALESVEDALVRLEKLLQEMHVSSSGSGKEHLKAACSDLEKIRKLKKEAEFLEASFRAKAASLQEENGDGISLTSTEQTRFMKGKDKGDGAGVQDKNSYPGGFWNFRIRPFVKQLSSDSSNLDEKTTDGSLTANTDARKSSSSEIHRFETLRSELTELEMRVQRSTAKSENQKDIQRASTTSSTELVPVQKNGNLIGKSLEKLKETSTDVLQGTQLLAIDVAAAMGLLRRAIIGDELTEKERKFLRRTLTDLASVVPIGVLMLLPVTAVGHAAMLAAIQRYFPALIPSTYGSDRLDLLRQLEKMKQTVTNDAKLDQNVDKMA